MYAVIIAALRPRPVSGVSSAAPGGLASCLAATIRGSMFCSVAGLPGLAMGPWFGAVFCIYSPIVLIGVAAFLTF